jgi:pyridoxal biosynthesis lyase PdxS
MHEPNDSAGSTGLMEKVRTGTAAQLSTQKDRATDGIGNVVEAVRHSTQHLRETQHETIAQYLDQAANQIERFSVRLKERNVGELWQDAQQFARRNPAMFIGSAFALGLLGARFLKSSASRGQQ